MIRSPAIVLFTVVCAGCTQPDPDGCSEDVVRAPVDGGVTPEGDPAPVSVSAFDWLADPYVPARRLPGRMHLDSSRFPEAPEGFDNYDWSHFRAIEGTSAVLLDTTGPGVVTRLWFTFRQGEHSTAPTEAARIHLFVDGAEVDLGGALGSSDPGITLGDLASGDHPAFPRPFAAGRDLSSGAIQIAVPIHFQESIRITLDHAAERETYYQVDWRELPCEVRVRSFDGALAPDEEAALLDAADLWVARAERGRERIERELTIEPGAYEMIEVAGPAVLRQVAWELSSGDAADLEAALAIDGETLVDQPIQRWTFATLAAGPFETALGAGGPSSGSMEYPAPIAEEASLLLRNGGAQPISVTVRVGLDSGQDMSGLGALRIACGAPMVPSTGGNVALSALSGERGHYAGQSLVLRGLEWGWAMLEGDHEVQVDDVYQLMGTGIEDYFGGAYYYLDGPFALPFVAATGFDLRGREHLAAGAVDVAQLRHHLVDTVNFERSFAFEYEVAAPRTTYEHCVFWYRDGDPSE